MSSLKDKVVLITGASSGIGQGTAVMMASHACCLALTGRNAERLEQTACQCMQQGLSRGKILLLAGDLTQESTVKEAIETTVSQFGRIDILVNNAGVAMWDDILNTSMEHFDMVMNTNIRVPFNLTRQAAPHLIDSKGVVINVSSVAGLRPLRELMTYSMSKAALDQFTRLLAVQLGPKGVRVNSVNPGEIRTETSSVNNMTHAEYDKLMRKVARFQPLGRSGAVDEVARAIVFLASDESSFISGATLPVDGGWTAVHPYTSDTV